MMNGCEQKMNTHKKEHPNRRVLLLVWKVVSGKTADHTVS